MSNFFEFATPPLSGATILARLLAVDGAGSLLDADKLDGADWAAPLAIGTGTPAAGTFTTLTANTSLTMANAANVILNTSTGTKIGTGTTQKLGFWNATPIVQPSATTDLRLVLINTGLLASGGASPLDLNGGALTAATGSFSGQITSTLATGTAPFSVASTTVVPNLNVSQLLGATWAAPGTIGSGTPSTGAFTTLSATGQITSTLATGTAPFSIASTTVVPNLNVSQLLGGTWAVPGTIGSTTPSSGAFTTLTANGAATLTAGTASTTTTTGTLVVTGGVGISGAFNAGANSTIGGSTTTLQMVVSNSGTTTTSFARMQVKADSAPTVSMDAFSSTYTGTSWGITLANYQSISANSSTSNGFIVGHLANKPIIFGISTNEVARLSSGTLASGVLSCAYTLDASNSTTASVTLAGGLAVAKAAYIGTTLNLPQATGTTLTVTSTDAASVSLSGGILLDGATGKTVKYTNGTANGAVATTLGSVGPTGSTAGDPQGWLRVNIGGTDRYIPFW